MSKNRHFKNSPSPNVVYFVVGKTKTRIINIKLSQRVTPNKLVSVYTNATDAKDNEGQREYNKNRPRARSKPRDTGNGDNARNTRDDASATKIGCERFPIA